MDRATRYGVNYGSRVGCTKREEGWVARREEGWVARREER